MHKWGCKRISSETAPVEVLMDPHKRIKREMDTKRVTDRCRAVLELSQALNATGAINLIDDIGRSTQESELLPRVEKVEKHLKLMQEDVQRGACTPLGICL